jgi:hypothetical protein
LVPAPTVTITQAPSNSTSTSATIIYSETGAVTSTVCTLDSSPVTCSNTEADLTGLSSGAHTFAVEVTGPGGNDSVSATWTVLSAAPTVTITQAPLNSTSTSATIVYSTTGSVTSTACTLDGSPVTCSSTQAVLAGLSAGSHTFEVEVSGSGGSTGAGATWTVEIPAPVVTITQAPSNSISPSATIVYSTTGAVTSTVCTLDGSPVTCSSTEAALSGLSVGAHTFAVEVTGPGGTDSDSVAWTVGTAAPAVAITQAPSSSTSTSDTITYSATGSVTSTTCALDGTPVTCSSTQAVLTGLSAGSHTFVVDVSGAGGSDSASTTWTVLSPPPEVSITEAPPSSTATSATILSRFRKPSPRQY